MPHNLIIGYGNSSVKPVLPGAEEEPDTMENIRKLKKELKIVKDILPHLREKAFDPKSKAKKSSIEYSKALNRLSDLQERLDEYTGGIDMDEAD